MSTLLVMSYEDTVRHTFALIEDRLPFLTQRQKQQLLSKLQVIEHDTDQRSVESLQKGDLMSHLTLNGTVGQMRRLIRQISRDLYTAKAA